MAKQGWADPLCIGDELGTSWNSLSTCACVGQYKKTKCLLSVGESGHG